METNHCKKCGKEIPTNKKKCEYCKKSINETWKNIGKGVISLAGTTLLTVVAKNKGK